MSVRQLGRAQFNNGGHIVFDGRGLGDSCTADTLPVCFSESCNA